MIIAGSEKEIKEEEYDRLIVEYYQKYNKRGTRARPTLQNTAGDVIMSADEIINLSRSVIQKEIEGIGSLKDQINEEFVKAVDMLLEC